MALWGTCAGLICIANKLTESEPKPMGLLKAEVSRNWFGRQIDSFETDVSFRGIKGKIKAVFIRAPIVNKVNKEVEILSRLNNNEIIAIKQNKKEIADRINKVLKMVGITLNKNKYPFELSGGEQQRVAIARALLNEPKLIIADEPTGNLDPQTSQEIMKLFKSLHEKGMTLLMATHDYQMIVKFPGKIFKCENGKVFEVIAKT